MPYDTNSRYVKGGVQLDNIAGYSLHSQSYTKIRWDTSTQHCFITQLTHQILHTNIGKARRQQCVPTILTETEAFLY